MKFLFAIISLFSINAFCATYTVTNKLNSGIGSLRNAIIDANITPGVDTINFANNIKGTIDLGSALPDINDDLFISGPGANILTLRLFSNVGVINDRIFNFGLGSSGKNFTLSGISLKNARGNSYNFGSSVINAGGALYIAESNNLTIVDCLFDSNRSDTGGAILNVGNLTVIGSQFLNNASNTFGGAIYNLGDVNISNTVFQNNTAKTYGGAFYNGPKHILQMNNVTFIKNSSLKKGGAITTRGPTTMNNVTFESNTSEAGGACEFMDTRVDVNTSSFIKNKSTLNGGAVLSTANTKFTKVNFIDNEAQGEGGALFNITTLRINDSTFSGNKGSQGGAISLSNGQDVVITNVTLSKNKAGDGGAIYVLQAKPMLINCTLNDNTASSRGGAIANVMSEVQMVNTIISNNKSAQGQGVNCHYLPNNNAQIISRGHNLEDHNTCNLNAPTDIINQNPILAPLQNYGGFTMTHALRYNSPAVDAGDNDACPQLDQRGMVRSDGNGDHEIVCDIGAFELKSLVFPVPQPIPAPTPIPVP